MSNKINLEKIILSFSAKDRSRFKRYLDLEHKNTVFIALFDLLLKSKQNLTNEAIFQQLYPLETFRDDRIRLLYSRAIKIMHSFIESTTISSIEKSETKHFQLKNLKQVQPKLLNDQTSYAYLVDYETAIEVSDLIIDKGNRAIEPKLQEAHDRLDDYYFIEKLKLACNAQNYSNMSGHRYDLAFLDYLVVYLQSYSMQDKPLLYLYFNTYKMIMENDEKYFQLVFDYLNTMSIPEHTDYREVLLTMLNFSIQRLNRGNMDERYRIFKLYQWQIESRNIFVNQKLPSNTYKNVINLALNIKEFDWTLDFIESQKENLLSAHPLEDYQLVMAKYYYETEKFEDCIQLITIARPLDILDNLLLRVLQCKAYYELDDYELLDTSIHNAKIYLLRHKSKAYQYVIFKNFFIILFKILKTSQTRKGKEKLILEINENKALAEKKWLLSILT